MNESVVGPQISKSVPFWSKAEDLQQWRGLHVATSSPDCAQLPLL